LKNEKELLSKAAVRTGFRREWRVSDVPETELKFESGITRAMLSGILRHTIRAGRRKFRPNITIHGYNAKVAFFKHTTLLHTDMQMLYTEFGWRTMFQAVMGLQKFYPGITVNDPITIVKYRLDV
jgi:hypothetical protein